MAFTNSFRMERVYFERLKSMIDILKPYLNTETDEKLKSILENSIDDNGAILLLYRNLGECWAELSDLIKKANERIDSLDDKSEKYHDEINERIDEVNNYIMGILREIEARLETVEQDLATLSRNIILDLERVNDEYTLSYKGDPVDFAQLAEWVSFPDNVIIRGVVNGEETVFHLREFDTDETSGVFEFFATGLIDNVVHEITVTVLPDDSVNVTTEIQTMKEYSAGNGIDISANDEISVDTDVIQEKLKPGSGISIDPDTHEIKNTAQGATYTAGSGILINNNVISNNLGVGSMGALTREIDNNNILGNFTAFNTNNPMIFICNKSFQLNNYKGVYKNNLIRAVPASSESWVIRLLNFESDLELSLAFTEFVSNFAYNKNITPSHAIYYYRNSFKTKILAENGIIKPDYNISVPSAANDPGSILLNGLSETDISYVRVNNNELFYNFIVVINPTKTTKTSAEWLNFINTQWVIENNVVKAPFQIGVYGTEN